MRLDLENHWKCPTIQKQHQAKLRKLRKYDSAIDTSCALETNDLNLTTANFDSYGNVSFDPCEFTLHTAANAENDD